jgi:hypothetical protein
MSSIRASCVLLVLLACSSSSSQGGGGGFGSSSGGKTDAAAPNDSGGSQGGDAASSGEGGGSGGGGQCATGVDCKTHADNCGSTCTCIALGVNEPAPDCGDAGTIKCNPDPCTGKTAVCNASNQCVIQ